MYGLKSNEMIIKILKSILSLTGNQCEEYDTGVAWRKNRVLKTNQPSSSILCTLEHIDMSGQ